MTLNDIRDEVGELGFDEPPRNTAALVRAVRRALAVIYTERGVHAVARFFKRVPENTVAVKEIFHRGGEKITVEAGYGAYSLFLSGKGSFTVTDGKDTVSYAFDTEGGRYCGYLKENATFTFIGEGCYSVYNFYLYPGFYSETKSAIPTSVGSEEYLISDIIPDYMSALGVPKSPGGSIIAGAKISTDRVTLPTSYSGEVIIEYRKAPASVSADAPDKDLGLPRDTEHLVPLLPAAYMWLDDDIEKAYYYMSLYREGVAALKLYNTRAIDTGVGDVSGWAG